MISKLSQLMHFLQTLHKHSKFVILIILALDAPNPALTIIRWLIFSFFLFLINFLCILNYNLSLFLLKSLCIGIFYMCDCGIKIFKRVMFFQFQHFVDKFVTLFTSLNIFFSFLFFFFLLKERCEYLVFCSKIIFTEMHLTLNGVFCSAY